MYYQERNKIRNIHVKLLNGRRPRLTNLQLSMKRNSRHPQHNWIMKDFTHLIALYHGLELLVKHGARVFLKFFDEHPEKSWIQSDDQLTALLERLRDDLGVIPVSLDSSVVPDVSCTKHYHSKRSLSSWDDHQIPHP